MTERVQIEGRAATVAYLDDDWNPVDRADATLLKITFDDGGVLFGFARRAERNERQAASFCDDPRFQHLWKR